MQYWIWSKLIHFWIFIVALSLIKNPHAALQGQTEIEFSRLPESIQYYLRGFFGDAPNDLRTFDILMGFDKPSRDMNNYFSRIVDLGESTLKVNLQLFDNGWLTNATLLSFENRFNPRTGKKILFDKINVAWCPSTANQNISWESVSELATNFRDDLPWARMRQRFDLVKLFFNGEGIPPNFDYDILPITKHLVATTEMAIDETMVRAVEQFCKNGLKQLDLQMFFMSDLNRSILQHCHNLTHLSILSYDDKHLIEFPRKAQLQSLSIDGWMIGNNVPAIKEFKNLKKLSLRELALDRVENNLAVLQILRQLSNLEILDLESESSSPEILKYVFQHQNLKELRMEIRTMVDLDEINPHIQAPNNKLERLTLYFDSKTFFSNCSGIFPNLKYLHIGEIPLEASCLSGLAHLKTLIFKSTTSVLEGHNPSVEIIEVSASSIVNDNFASQLSRLFSQFPNLKEVKFHKLKCGYQDLKTQLIDYPHSLVYWGSYYSAKIYRPS